ncbi:MAG TPA: lysylphosphatidylglycerol synthase transmembrane domain-containing protein [Gemmatimonadaceae bacterium]|nr:lysylphosphatidylglycerol synthase transmembrane domain-containing protein [Gemmatimonadaceae bacterium]
MKFPWRGAIGLALTVGLLWWVFRDVPWHEVMDVLRGANVPLAVLSVIVATMIFPLRARRWRPILHAVEPNLPFGPLWRATAMGFMANSVLPSRMGELVRAYALTRETPVTFSAAFASLVVDRVFDGFVVLLLMVLAMLDPAFPAGVSAATYAGTGAAVIVAIALVLYAIVFFPDRLIRLFELFARRVAPRFEERGRQLLRAFADGLSVLRHPARFLEVFLWALALWVTQAVSFWIMFKAVGVTAPFSAALFVQGLIVLFVALPSTPGFFGLFEAAAKVGLVMYGVSESLAVAWGFIFHVLSLIPITLIGLYYVARAGMTLGDLKQIGK